MEDPGWEERVRAEAKIHSEVQDTEKVKGWFIGCGTITYIFACIIFPWLLLAIPAWLVIMFIRAKPRQKS